MLNSYFLKKYGTFSIYFFLNKMPHSILPGTAAHFVFKSQACDLHTNFLIKSLSKGKDSCHADRQLTKQFYCFFPRKRVRKTRKSQLGRANSQYTTFSAAAIIWTFPGQPKPGDKTEIWAHFKDFSTGLKCLIQHRVTVKCQIPHRGATSPALTEHFCLRTWGKPLFLDNSDFFG